MKKKINTERLRDREKRERKRERERKRDHLDVCMSK